VQAYSNSLTQFLPNNQGYALSLSTVSRLKMVAAGTQGFAERTSAAFLKSVAFIATHGVDRAIDL